jgi:DNA-binding CsgD family transcriptional regulator
LDVHPVAESDGRCRPSRWADLTAREAEVAEHLALGATNREIAETLGTSIKTVDSHRGAVMRKLGLRNNVELARHALREGWVTL